MRPLHLRPHLVVKPWGGRRLADLGRDLPPDEPVGESWDVADLAPEETSQGDAASRVVGGPHDGETLHELIASHGVELLGRAAPTSHGRFPLLVKHLDAAQHLSVQVHPPDCLLADHPSWTHKTESWVVVDAEPDAVMFLGVRDGVTLDDVTTAMGGPDLVDLLRPVPARRGDVHHLPAGLLHALGAGIVVAEVQTPSDTTFRLYDWTDEYGRRPRDLHLDEAATCLAAAWDVNVSPPPVRHDDGVVVDTDHYVIERHRRDDDDVVAVAARDAACVVIVLDGHLDGDEVGATPAGECVLLPASWSGEVRVAAGTVWLEAHLVR